MRSLSEELEICHEMDSLAAKDGEWPHLWEVWSGSIRGIQITTHDPAYAVLIALLMQVEEEECAALGPLTRVVALADPDLADIFYEPPYEESLPLLFWYGDEDSIDLIHAPDVVESV